MQRCWQLRALHQSRCPALQTLLSSPAASAGLPPHHPNPAACHILNSLPYLDTYKDRNGPKYAQAMSMLEWSWAMATVEGAYGGLGVRK